MKVKVCMLISAPFPSKGGAEILIYELCKILSSDRKDTKQLLCVENLITALQIIYKTSKYTPF